MKKRFILISMFLAIIAINCKPEKGEIGPQGSQGVAGANGLDGTNGPQGPQGPQGEKGPTGDVGLQGYAGPSGKLNNYSTGWQNTNWVVDNSVSQGLRFIYQYSDANLTQNILINSFYQVYLYSKVSTPLKLSNIPQTYRKIGTQYYDIKMEPSIGGIKFICSNVFAKESANSIKDSLNADNIKFNFSSIYK